MLFISRRNKKYKKRTNIDASTSLIRGKIIKEETPYHKIKTVFNWNKTLYLCVLSSKVKSYVWYWRVLIFFSSYIKFEWLVMNVHTNRYNLQRFMNFSYFCNSTVITNGPEKFVLVHLYFFLCQCGGLSCRQCRQKLWLVEQSFFTGGPNYLLTRWNFPISGELVLSSILLLFEWSDFNYR